MARTPYCHFQSQLPVNYYQLIHSIFNLLTQYHPHLKFRYVRPNRKQFISKRLIEIDFVSVWQIKRYVRISGTDLFRHGSVMK